MIKTSIRILPAAFALAVASVALPAMAQSTTAPSTTEKVEHAGKEAWDSTKSGTKKAVKATEHGGEKAWDATKRGSEKAWDATKRGANATGKAVSDAGGAAADATRKAGDKIGEQIPGTAQHDAKTQNEAKKP
ncbi:hypothetical protein ACQ858_17300 [Variovorax ureilyticus]|uniref:hypothetical protein n=1 Tax=Variovorax ureilyticus TaxID=1836198 RepID=UPI003D6727E3